MQKLFSNCCFLRSLKVFLLLFWFVAIAADMHLPSTDIKTVQSNGLTFSFTTSQPTSLVMPTMSTTTRGNFFTNTEGQSIFNSTLHIPQYWNGSAWKNGIESGAIVNADINAAAGITYGKLSLANSIVNADIATGAAIAYGKLALTGQIVNADVSGTAAIARGKIATGTVNRVVVNDGSTGALSDAAAITTGRALISDSNGIPTHSNITTTELGFSAGVTSSLCGINQGCTEANKTFTSPVLNTPNLNGGTASNSSRILLPTETTTNLSGLTNTAGLVAFDSTQNKVVYNNGTSWTAVGSGSGAGLIGDRELITNTNFETGGAVATGWNAYADGAGASPVDGTGGSPNTTCTRDSGGASVITGTGSLLITKAGSANRQGEGCSSDVTVGYADRGKDLQIDFDYRVQSGTFTAGTISTDSDIEVFFYDISNAALIPTSDKVLYFSSINDTYHYRSVIHTATNTATGRLIFDTVSTTTNNFTIDFDNISLHPYVNLTVPSMTDWVNAGTNVITAVLTAPTQVGNTKTIDALWWRRVGGNMEIRMEWKQTAAGTNTAGSGDYLFAIPSGYTIDTSKLTVYAGASLGSNSTMPVPSNSVGFSSVAESGGYSPGGVFVYDSTRVRFAGVRINSGGSGGFGVQAGSTGAAALTTATATFVASYSVPIVGWSASQTAVRVDSSDFGWTNFPSLTSGGTAASPGTNLISGVTTAPTLTTVTSHKAQYRRVGENMEIMWDLVISAGSAGSGKYVLNLPPGYSIDTNKVTVYTGSTGSAVPSGSLGDAFSADTTNAGKGIVYAYSSTQLTVYFAALTPANTNCFWGSTCNAFSTAQAISIHAHVPISGWTGNQRAPLLINSVTSGIVGMLRVEAATVSSAGVVSNATTSGWISCGATSAYACTFSSGLFTSTPVCVASPNIVGFTAPITAQSSTGITVSVANANNSVITSNAFNIYCIGPRGI